MMRLIRLRLMRYLFLFHGLGLDDLPVWVWLVFMVVFTLCLVGAVWWGGKLAPDLTDPPEDEQPPEA